MHDQYFIIMETGLIDLSSLNTQQAAEAASEILFDAMYNGEHFCKQASQQILAQIYDNIVNRSSKASSKFYTLEVLRDLILQKERMFITVLNNNGIMELFEKLALETDPKKKISEKGFKMFENDENGMHGNNFMRILLQMITYLGRTFYKGAKGPTKFKKILTKLEDKILLPKQFIYFPQQSQKSTQISKKNPSSSPNNPTTDPLNHSNVPSIIKAQLKKPDNFASLVGFAEFKIDEYVQKLKDEQDAECVQRMIIDKHKIFEGEIKKFQQIGEQIYQYDETLVNKYLNIQQFLVQENLAYNQWISNNETKAYLDQIYQIFDTTLQNQHPLKDNTNIQQETKRSSFQKGKGKAPVVEQQRISIKKEVSVNKSRKSNRQNNLLGVSAIRSIFDKLQSRSKSPNVGFKLVKQSLEKEKSLIHAHPPRNRTEGMRTIASTLTKTGMRLGNIFKNPPNISPPYKNFEGQIVLPCKQIENVLFDIKKQQGYRRFKNAIFRNRYPLFENQSIQIGFKSQAIFEPNDDGFNEILSIQLYFGNKTNRQLRNFEIILEGDQNSLVYTNPRDFPSQIDAQQQVRYQLMIVPIQIPYSFLTLKLVYHSFSEVIHTTVALPNSILKMTSYIEIERTQQLQYEQISTVKLKSEHFRLSHHMPPNSLKKYIKQLNQLSSYAQYSLPGSTIDYQLYCLIEIMKDYEANLKIIIRPDLNAVIQIGLIDPSEDSLKYSKFFLQNLQMILQENGN